MLIFTNETILTNPAHGVDAQKLAPQYRAAHNPALRPFLPGQLYLIKYMGLPTICTIWDRTDTTITWACGEVSVNVFNAQVICYLGYRKSLFGYWLPWARIDPKLLVNDLPVGVSNDPAFWNLSQSELDHANKMAAPERNGMTHLPDGN